MLAGCNTAPMQTQDSAAWMVLRMQRLEPLPRHVGVDGGGRNIGMPQQQLHHTQIRPVVEQVGGKGVAQRVG